MFVKETKGFTIQDIFYPYVLMVLENQYLKYKYLQMIRKICFETNFDKFVLMTLEKVLLLRNKIPLNCMRKHVLKYYFGKNGRNPCYPQEGDNLNL